jgi:FtsP/CotA-like multicopper oxidase with cupredoxin domain
MTHSLNIRLLVSSCLLLLAGLGAPTANAQVPRTVEYDLTVSEEVRSPAGNPVLGLVINGSSPGPVLRFREGDIARITVRNGLEDGETSMHWHGLLLPNAMDGVPYLTTPPIPPGGQQVYEFPIRQSGTYWYHSHTGLQEQRGVMGAIVIEALEADLQFDREHVLVLSDWTDEDPNEVMRTLMRGSEWYALRKGNMQSLWGAWKAGEMSAYLEREYSRMSPMDISDIAYDAFLINGQSQSGLPAKPGERVLLRIVNAGASTYFHLSSGAGPLTVVASDGMPVVPVEVNRLLVGMAETYDLILTMPAEPAAVEFRATAHDGSGHASVVLGEGPSLSSTDPPKPNYYSMDEVVMAGLASSNVKRGKRAATADRPFTPYALLRSVVPTTIAHTGEVRELTMRLTGDMRRYLWGFDGKTLSEESTIRVKRGEVLRIEFINDTMMHHPLHLHGHFFRVLNGQGTHAPLKHTVDVAPMGKVTIEWVADETEGDWFFHCHMLYHMDAGMARVFTYNQDPSYQPTIDPKLIDPYFMFLDGALLSNMFSGHVMLMTGSDDYFLRWHSGVEEHHGSYDRDVDLGWSRYIDSNMATELGFRLTDVVGEENRAFVGFRYRLPYLVHSLIALDSEGDVRVELAKEFQLSERLSLSADLQYDTLSDTEWSSYLHWTLSKQFDVVAGYHSDHELGIGLGFRF